MYIYKVSLIFFLLYLTSCSGDGDHASKSIQPVATTLLFPYDNEACYEGTVVSDTESIVKFQWKTSADTDNYRLHLKNLISDETQSFNTDQTFLEVSLIRSTPYSWFIESGSNEVDEVAKSEVWKFYNAGEGIESYVPFPAETISPKTGDIISNNINLLTLSWKGSDPDNNIKDYLVYFGTENPPSHLENTVTTNSLNVQLSSGNGIVYYWRVISRDSDNNTSQSAVFQFKVN